MLRHESNVRIEIGGAELAFRQLLNLKRHTDAGADLPRLQVADMTLAGQSDAGGEGLLRERQTLAKSGDFLALDAIRMRSVHAVRFAHAERFGNSYFRHGLNDAAARGSYDANMASYARKTRPIEVYEAFRQASGWYLAAWRDFSGLTLDDMSAELGHSKGYISDLETGAVRAGRPPTRFNRDLIEKVARVVNTTGGRLIDVNPFTMWEHAERLDETLARLPDGDRAAVLDMAERLAKREDAA